MMNLLSCINAMNDGPFWGGQHIASLGMGDFGLPALGVGAVVLFALRHRPLALKDRIGILVLSVLVSAAVAAALGGQFVATNLGVGTLVGLGVLIVWQVVRQIVVSALARRPRPGFARDGSWIARKTVRGPAAPAPADDFVAVESEDGDARAEEEVREDELVASAERGGLAP